MYNITIIGRGSWGSALCNALSQADIANVKTLGHKLDAEVIATSDVIILAIPSSACEDVITALEKHELHAQQIILLACKGFASSPSLISDVLEETLPCTVGVISGPNFAREVIEGKFTATNLAIKNNYDIASALAQALSSDNFRIIAQQNIEAMQIAGTMKNIMAIWAGISEGRHLGHNALSYILTLGLQEIEGLIKSYNVEPHLSSLALFGDYFLTTTSNQSRNYRFGLELARHPEEKIDALIRNYPTLVEGAKAVYTATNLAHARSVKLPLTNLLLEIFEGKSNPSAAIDKLYRL